MNLQAGAKLLVRTGSRLTTSVSLLRTVYAINNPSDVWTVDLGLSARGIFSKRSTHAE